MFDEQTEQEGQIVDRSKASEGALFITETSTSESELHDLYHEQQRRMQCYGCGDTIELF